MRVVSFGEWSLVVVQRCGGYTYEQGEKESGGQERGSKEMDGCPLTF
jgi:hypothetical protein